MNPGSERDLGPLLQKAGTSGRLALDLETFGEEGKDALNPWRGEVRLLSLCAPGAAPVVLDVKNWTRLPDALHRALEELEVVAHNARFDLRWLAVRFGVRPRKIFCTLSASRLLSAGTDNRNDLDSVLERFLGVPPGEDCSGTDWGGMFLTDAQFEYAARDVRHLPELQIRQQQELKTAGLGGVAEMEMRLVPVVLDLELAGIRVDSEALMEIQRTARREQAQVEARLRALLARPTLNLSSPKQILAALRAAGLSLEDTSERTLAASEDERLVPLVLAFRSREKLAQQATGLLHSIENDGRIHARFDPLGTDTGRFSSDSPNLQNIPRGRMRRCFTAGEGNLLVRVDYSQIELRAVADLAGDRAMIEAFSRGEDLHRLTASAVLQKSVDEVSKDDRQLAKSVNFGLVYGQGAEGLVASARQNFGVRISLEEALLFRDRFFSKYRALADWHKAMWKEASRRVGEVRCGSGRRRLLPEGISRWNRFTALVNTPVQGGAADGMKAAMLALAVALPRFSQMVSTVHDELLIECPAAEALQTLDVSSAILCQAMQPYFPSVRIETEGASAQTWG